MKKTKKRVPVKKRPVKKKKKAVKKQSTRRKWHGGPRNLPEPTASWLNKQI
jgi:hypothetical protein